ncbi:hypothetical protein J1N10_16965 [Carboxylicivirga sp. A043]|uniref:hypothetical protein n=1 Tax=Carboxylicivirga litoralis TaxID=2816963 RepID=UPI0021CB449A|nr:hypothetical protein [Carboxylicivirga sp. A043]MCU4157670.1 hypothetical protein [Carboxylicivirga sp. A043]
MKMFTVSVPEDKVKFMAELLDNLCLSWSMSPGHGEEPSLTEPPKTYEVDEESRKKAAKVREESLKDVISKIEALRKK